MNTYQIQSPMIEIVNVKKTYQGLSGEVEALKGVSLQIEAGRILGLLVFLGLVNQA